MKYAAGKIVGLVANKYPADYADLTCYIIAIVSSKEFEVILPSAFKAEVDALLGNTSAVSLPMTV